MLKYAACILEGGQIGRHQNIRRWLDIMSYVCGLDINHKGVIVYVYMWLHLFMAPPYNKHRPTFISIANEMVRRSLINLLIACVYDLGVLMVKFLILNDFRWGDNSKCR